MADEREIPDDRDEFGDQADETIVDQDEEADEDEEWDEENDVEDEA